MPTTLTDTSSAKRIANIGTGERRKRLLFGVVALGAGALIAGLLIAVRAPLIWRLPLVFLFYVGALGVFQSRDKTWVRLASRGLRDMDQGPQAISDAEELRRVRRQARAVYVKSVVAAAILTAIALVPQHG